MYREACGNLLWVGAAVPSGFNANGGICSGQVSNCTSCERKCRFIDGPGTGAGAASVEARRVARSAREEMRRMIIVEMRRTGV